MSHLKKRLQDYYPFGMQMPGRNGTISGGEYRYAFNGMETDAAVSGTGNSYTTQFRQYDPRLGRWKSLDPLAAKYASMSPYIGMGNNPNFYTDPLGLEPNGGGEGDEGGDEGKKGSESNPHDDVSPEKQKEILKSKVEAGDTDDQYFKVGENGGLYKADYDEESGTWFLHNKASWQTEYSTTASYTLETGKSEITSSTETATATTPSADIAQTTTNTDTSIPVISSGGPYLTPEQKTGAANTASDYINKTLAATGIGVGTVDYAYFSNPYYTTAGGNTSHVSGLNSFTKNGGVLKTQLGLEYIDDFGTGLHPGTSASLLKRAANSKLIKVGGKVIGYAGAVYTAVDVLIVGNIMGTSTASDNAWAVADIAVGVATMYLGPAGWVVGGLYFLTREYGDDVFDGDWVFKVAD